MGGYIFHFQSAHPRHFLGQVPPPGTIQQDIAHEISLAGEKPASTQRIYIRNEKLELVCFTEMMFT